MAGRRVTFGLGVALGLAIPVLAVMVSRRQPVVGPCQVTRGPVAMADLPEASGLAVGRRVSGVLWSHNDSGNDAVLFALDGAGTVRGRVRVPVRMRDWEDVSAGRCPAGDCLYLADIGDNGTRRPTIAILRVPEPAADDVTTSAPEVFTATYPDGPHNAEALFVVGDDAFIVTKDRVGALYRARALPSGGGAIDLEHIGALGLSTVTDAETSVDGRTVAVRTPAEVVLYRTDAVITGAAVPYLRVHVSGLRELQGEGVALDGSVLHLSSEGRPWRQAGSLVSLRCRLPEP